MRRGVVLKAASGVALLLALGGLGCGSSGGDAAPQGTGPSGQGFGGSGSSAQPNGSAGTLAIAPGSNGALGGASSTGGSVGTGGSGNVPIVMVPPEKKQEVSFLAPVTAGKYVFSANPQSGRVAVIDAATYGVQLFNAGFSPTYLTAIPDDRGALVINDLSHDVTWFDVSGDAVSVVDAPLSVHPEANAWTTSPDGRFAIAWTSTPVNQMLDPTAGSQTVTVLDLEQRTSKQLSVGFHPTQVVIDDKSRHAFVVNDDGVSVVTLGADSEMTLLAPVSQDLHEDAAARDVSISPDGAFALVRADGSSQLRVVDLSRDDALSSYDFGAPITGMALSKDGTLAVLALPGIGQVALVPMPPTGDALSFERVPIPGEITSGVVLSDGAEVALLFQTGVANSHLTILDLREGQNHALRSVDLKGPVQIAFPAPGAASAIVYQTPITGSKKEGLFSGVPTLDKRSAKLVGTDAVPRAHAFDHAGQYALVTVGDEMSTVHGVYRVRLDTMQEDFLELASPPAKAATGIVEGVGRGFVAQTHPEGRITFIDLDTAHAHTITGFELAARILQ